MVGAFGTVVSMTDSNLLRVEAWSGGTSDRSKTMPLMMEFQIHPEIGPSLVTSTRGILWVVPRSNKVRSAARPVSKEQLFAEIVLEVADMGAESEWGNVHPMDMGGLQSALAHLTSYDLTDNEILVSTEWDPSLMGLTGVDSVDMLLGVPVTTVAWLPPNLLVVVPKDRDFVGFVLLFKERALALVHNACRGIAICRA